ncbi:GLUG motif-containing protein [Rummeliibacillus sp. POC4]|uniref:GLUG motif-containing protein n=1 Tax=Rummeliibacillus sp. POC4 TaxID=2305899 RepID=UPI000E667C1C|nr:GLUG motif-containing protein [Rummeliibacillus sp. POC4]RIJ65318.1 hypothetical protein D1606_08325 [Rummeliibacillus sp. POC4]
MAILISTPQELDNIRNNLKADYELANDIDMSDFGNWTPIGYYDRKTWVGGFEGNFDGKGHIIKNLTVNKPSTNSLYIGLFGQKFYGTIQNVGLENVSISGGEYVAGSLVGYCYSGTIKNCYVKGGSITSPYEVGGLIGKADTTMIEDCYSSCDVNVTSDSYGGGFIGTADSNSTFTNCYSTGKVTFTQTSNWNGYAGFAGFVRNADNVIFNNCYWDINTSNQSNTAKVGNPLTSNVIGITGKTTAEMKTKSTYYNWDFTDTWLINNDYPLLKVFGVPVVVNKETVNVDSYISTIQSNLNNSKKSTVQLNSCLYPFINTLNVRRSVLRSVEGYLSSLHTNATESHRIILNAIRQVDSYIQPIYSKVATFYPIDDIPVFGKVLAIENNSTTSNSVNMSELSYIINPSIVEVI